MKNETFIMTVEKSEWDRVIKEIEQLKKERFQVMWKFKLYADYVKSRNPSLHDRIYSDLGSDVEGYQTEIEQLKRINTLLEGSNKELFQFIVDHSYCDTARGSESCKKCDIIKMYKDSTKQIDKTNV